jgi:glutamate carboxypeptidase
MTKRKRLPSVGPSIALACGLAFAATMAHAAPDARLLAAAEKAQPAVIDNPGRWC